MQWTDLNGTNQQFRLVDSDGGYVRLINRHSNKALAVQGASTANGANIVQYSTRTARNQQWQLVQIGGAPPPRRPARLPTTIRWSSSGVLAGPKPDSAHPDIAAIKDYTVVRHNGAWQVYATTASPSQGWNLVHFSFADWPQANAATHTYLDTHADRARLSRGAAYLLLRAARPLVHGLPDRACLPTRPARIPATRARGPRRGIS